MITLTESAANYIKTLLEKDPSNVGVKVGVKAAGCSGFSYTINLIGQQEQSMKVFECHGVRVFVDPSDLEYIKDTKVDYLNQGLNRRVVFINPQEVARCGCGESFAVSDK